MPLSKILLLILSLFLLPHPVDSKEAPTQFLHERLFYRDNPVPPPCQKLLAAELAPHQVIAFEFTERDIFYPLKNVLIEFAGEFLFKRTDEDTEPDEYIKSKIGQSILDTLKPFRKFVQITQKDLENMAYRLLYSGALYSFIKEQPEFSQEPQATLTDVLQALKATQTNANLAPDLTPFSLQSYTLTREIHQELIRIDFRDLFQSIDNSEGFLATFNFPYTPSQLNSNSKALKQEIELLAQKYNQWCLERALGCSLGKVSEIFPPDALPEEHKEPSPKLNFFIATIKSQEQKAMLLELLDAVYPTKAPEAYDRLFNNWRLHEIAPIGDSGGSNTDSKKPQLTPQSPKPATPLVPELILN